MPKVHVNGTPCRLKINLTRNGRERELQVFKKIGDENRINRE